MKFYLVLILTVGLASGQFNRLCNKPSDEGECDVQGREERFFSLPGTKYCQGAWVCPSGADYYTTLSDCREACLSESAPRPNSNMEQYCLRAPPAVECKGLSTETMAFYDAESGKCKEVTGCLWTDNGFEDDTTCSFVCTP
ncbi:monobin-like [Ornithodoros turicata]|uniref:monobin-like n=1 Tax=Ornithodoros turicata TaxID=34597 RepID=UPI003138BAFA